MIKKREQIRTIHYCLTCNVSTENLYKQNKMSAFICNDCCNKTIDLNDFNIVYKKKRYNR
jgi:hypothetical protein